MLPNAVPVNGANFALSRRDLGIADDAFMFGLASRALQSKGWDIAIEALKRVRASTDRAVHLVFCGDGEDYDELTKRYGRTPGVVFLGYQSAIISFYRLCDCCILPTRFPGESCPFTLIESLQAGTPIIATDLGGIRDLLEREGLAAGIVVPNLDEDDLFTTAVEKAMLDMLDDEVRRGYVEAAESFASAYSFERLVSEYEVIYKRAGGWRSN
jgi:glycosyltransferase involved in cell wall biosynthesis